MKIFSGILHDTYPDENGKETAYTDRIVGIWKRNVFKCVSLPDFMQFEISKKDFESKVCEVKQIF